MPDTTTDKPKPFDHDAWEREYVAEGVRATEQAALHKLTLTDIKYCDFQSQETSCFVAKIRRAGKVIGKASNEGCGGPNHIDVPTPDLDDQLLDRWVDDEMTKYLEAKDKARMDKWIDRQVKKNSERGMRSAIIRDDSKKTVSVVPVSPSNDMAWVMENVKGAAKASLVELW